MSSNPLRAYLPDHDLMTVAGVPAVYHCHHFNLFLEQTVDDALGPKAGGELRFQAAREVSHDLLASVMALRSAVTPVERLETAAEMFAWMGHGKLAFGADSQGGSVRGEYMHYGFSWREKYGQVVRRRTPADAFAAGFAAAAIEVAFDLPRESMAATETACVAMRAPTCTFTLTPGPPAAPRPAVTAKEIQQHVQPVFAGQGEQTIAAIATGLRGFTEGVAGDVRGLMETFGVYVTMHLANYYNRLSFDTLQQVEVRAPKSLRVLEDLLRESGHVCVFNTFGGILLSPEWEGMVGPLTGDPGDVVVGSLAIARALGFGHWTLVELDPGHRMVLSTPSSYESAYYLARHGLATRPSEYFLQGAAMAIARLADRVDWKARPKLTQDYYHALFRSGAPGWQVEQTRCIACGHDRSEVVVTRVA